MNDALTIRLDRPLADKLDALAEHWDGTREELLIDAVRRYVDEESAVMAGIQAGEADIAAGRYSTHQEFMADLRAERGRKDAA